VIVDIALKALSPAINDPTTAVLANRPAAAPAARGRPAQSARHAAARRRRHAAADLSHPELERLRAAGADRDPPPRHQHAGAAPAARDDRDRDGERARPAPPGAAQELALLDVQVNRIYGDTEDQALARVPDTQGLGGASGR